MTARDWKPGDVGCLAYGDGAPFAFRTDKGWAWIDGSTSPVAPEYDEALRPLVVIDPAVIHEDYTAEQALGHLPHWLRIAADKADAQDRANGHRDGVGHGRIARALADQIGAQARPPKPEEPTGLGAVVEDAEGERWVRVNQRTGTQEWRRCDFNGEFRRWPAVAAVRVLSDGVQS